MKHRRFAVHRFILSLLMLGATVPVTAGSPIAQGVAEIDVSYEGMGPMSAMLPKSERLFFRPGQTRIESGINVNLRGAIEGKQAQLMDFEGTKVAFVMPADHGGAHEDDAMLRFETMEETRSIAGFTARRVDAVDREDDTNRLPFWLTDEILIDHSVQPGLPTGFALDYTLIMNEGSAHKVVTRVEAKELPDELFRIPDDYRRIDIDSPAEIGKHLGEILGHNVKVVE